jgi:hypothetical protein
MLIFSPYPSAEYELNGYGLTGLYGLHDHDIPCSVCSVAASAVVMSECWGLCLLWGSSLRFWFSSAVPGRINCPASYNRQYNGWIM